MLLEVCGKNNPKPLLNDLHQSVLFSEWVDDWVGVWVSGQVNTKILAHWVSWKYETLQGPEALGKHCYSTLHIIYP